MPKGVYKRKPQKEATRIAALMISNQKFAKYTPETYIKICKEWMERVKGGERTYRLSREYCVDASTIYRKIRSMQR